MNSGGGEGCRKCSSARYINIGEVIDFLRAAFPIKKIQSTKCRISGSPNSRSQI